MDRDRIAQALANAYWRNPGHVRWEDLADAVIKEIRKDRNG